MGISKLQHLLLTALGFVVLCSSIHCMQLSEKNDDFESVVKQGYCDFLGRVGQEKFRELVLEDPVPLVAQGHEAVYRRFLNGVLIYRPNEGSDEGMVRLPIRDLANPLEGTFDLSHCGDAGNYLSISIGYRKGKKAANVNKVEIWFTPRFLIGKELNTTASHFQQIYGKWNAEAEVGIFLTWGRWDDLNAYSFVITQNMGMLHTRNLSTSGWHQLPYHSYTPARLSNNAGSWYDEQCACFHIQFV